MPASPAPVETVSTLSTTVAITPAKPKSNADTLALVGARAEGDSFASGGVLQFRGGKELLFVR
jgi:hypothetical protein